MPCLWDVFQRIVFMKIGNTLCIRLPRPFIVDRSPSLKSFLRRKVCELVMAKVIQLRNESWLIHWIIDNMKEYSENTRFLIPDRQSNFLLEWKTNFNKYNQIEYLMSMSV